MAVYQNYTKSFPTENKIMRSGTGGGGGRGHTQ